MATIIAGGAGFIGINLIKELSKKEAKIFLIDNFSNSRKDYVEFLKSQIKLNVIECDLSDQQQTNKAIKKIVDLTNTHIELWHLAANSNIQAGVLDPKIDLKDTFMTTFNLLESARIYGIKIFYFASSSAVYGDHGSTNLDENTAPMMPISNYGAMKLASEAQCFVAYESYLDKLRVFRFPNVVGSPATHGVILDLINKLKKNPLQLEVLGDGNQRKAYLHVKDLVKGMIYFSKIDIPKNITPIFNLGPDNDSLSVKWIAEQVVKKVSPRAKIRYGKKNRGWEGDVPKFSYSTKKAQSLGWKPKMNSEQSVKKAIFEIHKELSI